MAGLNNAVARAFADNYSGSGDWLDEANSHDMAASGAVFRDHDLNYFRFSGESGVAITSPDHSRLNIGGDIDIRVIANMDDWSGGTTAFIGKWHSDPDDRQYLFRIHSSGVLTLIWQDSGGQHDEYSSVIAPYANGEFGGVRVTLAVSSGDINFYTMDNPTADDPDDTANWTKLGTTQNAGATNIETTTNATVLLSIGAVGSSYTDTNIVSGISRAMIYDGIDGTLVFDLNAESFTASDKTTDTWVEDANSAVCTMQLGSGTVERLRLVTGKHWYCDGANDYLSTSDHANLDFGTTDNFTLGVSCLSYDWDGANSSVLAKWAAANAGYKLHVVSGGDPSFTIDDNSTVETATRPEPSNAVATTIIGVRDQTGDDDVKVAVAGTLGSGQADATTGTLENSDPVYLGRDTDGNYFRGEISAYCVIPSALTDGEVSTLHDNLFNQTISATITPATIAATVAMPAPAITVAATVTPATIAATVAMPAPTVTSLVTVTPAVIAATVSMPAPAVTSLVTVTPATIVLTVTMPAPAYAGLLIEPTRFILRADSTSRFILRADSMSRWKLQGA